jgi:pilus assembly protein CpaE
MADKKLDRLLAEAEKAYEKRDKRKGAKLIDEILRQDYNYPGVWQLLYRLFGSGRGFAEFQRSFTLQYYPDQLHQLRKLAETPAATPPPPEKKPSLLARIFRRKKTPAARVAPELETGTGAEVQPLNAQATAEATQTAVARQSATALAPPLVERPAPTAPARPPAIPGAGRTPAAAPPPADAAELQRAARSVAALRRAEASSGREKIHVVVVDDIPQTRETVIRTLRFQEDIEVDGTATNGVQAIHLVRELQPDVVIMDVNMPDMDGIAATEIIKREVPHTQIIILTVQDDVDYIRRAMNAGARDFLAKPPVIEELVAAVQRAANLARQEREKIPPPGAISPSAPAALAGKGKIISVYSPRGGAGCTTLACNLAAALYNPDTPVTVVDGNLQFGDVEVFFNVQSRSTILDLAPRVDVMDLELVEEVLTVHPSGIKFLSPSRPERSELVTGPQFSQILNFISQYYPYVIVDASHRLTDVTLAALDTSDIILLVTTQDIPSIARTRKFLDLMPLLGIDAKRVLIVMNQFDQRVGIDVEKVNQAFHRKVAAVLPLSSEVVIPSINRGAPFMLNKEMVARPIGRAFLSMVEALRKQLVELDQAVAVSTK